MSFNMPARRAFSARAAARPRTPSSAIACRSRKSIPRACPCCSSGSFPRSATSRRISTSISSTSGARRSSSTSTASTAANARRSRLPSSAIARAAHCAMSARRSASSWRKSIGSRAACSGGTVSASIRSASAPRGSIRAMSEYAVSWRSPRKFSVSRAICRSTSAASSSRAGVSMSSCPSRMPPCRSARSSSGTKMTSTPWGCSRSMSLP